MGRDFLVTTSPIFNDDGTLFGSVHIARDITERKLTEAALLAHAWLGLREVFIDYVHRLGLRLALYFGFGVLYLACLIWAVDILWVVASRTRIAHFPDFGLWPPSGLPG